METYGAYLRKLRAETGLTIQKTADLIGVSSQYLSEIERGGRKCLNDEKTAVFIEKLSVPEDKAGVLLKLHERMADRVPLPKELISFLEENPDIVRKICEIYKICA